MVELATPVAVEIAAAYAPMVVRWPSRSLLTSDNPVLLLGDESAVALAIKTAGGIFLGIDDATGLLLWNRECWSGVRYVGQLELGQSWAQELNRAVVAQSVRQVLWHPKAEREQLLGVDYAFPPYRTHVAPVHVDEQCRKIARALEWADDNPDQPHPLSRTPLVRVDSGARPISPKLRRQLTSKGFFDQCCGAESSGRESTMWGRQESAEPVMRLRIEWADG